MKLKLLDGNYAVCRLDKEASIPNWINTQSFFSITKTDDELSVVCLDENIPNKVQAEKDWKILKIQGPLDFSLVGILSKLSGILAQEQICIFAVSTYDTDYILVKDRDIRKTCSTLELNGYKII